MMPPRDEAFHMHNDFHALALKEGNEPILCSRMHFAQWADKVDAMFRHIVAMETEAPTLPIVRLSKEQTSTLMSREARSKAINAAYRATMSPHEHQWTNEEQFQMACFVLWAHQRLLAIDQAVRGDLIHEKD